MGVELEVFCDEAHAPSIAEFSKNEALLKSDSSINGEGFEIVTTPMSLDYQLDYWEDFMDNFSTLVYPDWSCGMHVHISRKPLSQLQIGKILVFLNNPENSTWIDKIAGRLANSYCERKEKTLADVENQSSRYEALNLLNNETIEFRLFSSTNSAEVISCRLEFVHALVSYCAVAELDELEWDYFMQWVYISSPKDSYSYFKEWLETTEESYPFCVGDNDGDI
jgi:hypothetical protein